MRALRPVRVLVAVAAFFASLLAGGRPARAGAEADACAGRGTSLLVDTDARRIHLCKDGRQAGSFPVSLGRGGVGKRRAGDARTPLGTYPLGSPRSSSKFHQFIPVAYPTAAQRRAGYSGGSIGIHGPSRDFVWLGRLADVRDWTNGCIAVNRDLYIEAIARFVRTAGASVVTITGTEEE